MLCLQIKTNNKVTIMAETISSRYVPLNYKSMVDSLHMAKNRVSAFSKTATSFSFHEGVVLAKTRVSQAAHSALQGVNSGLQNVSSFWEKNKNAIGNGIPTGITLFGAGVYALSLDKLLRDSMYSDPTETIYPYLLAGAAAIKGLNVAADKFSDHSSKSFFLTKLTRLTKSFESGAMQGIKGISNVTVLLIGVNQLANLISRRKDYEFNASDIPFWLQMITISTAWSKAQDTYNELSQSKTSTEKESLTPTSLQKVKELSLSEIMCQTTSSLVTLAALSTCYAGIDAASEKMNDVVQGINTLGQVVNGSVRDTIKQILYAQNTKDVQHTALDLVKTFPAVQQIERLVKLGDLIAQGKRVSCAETLLTCDKDEDSPVHSTAFRDLTRETHPDKNNNSEASQKAQAHLSYIADTYRKGRKWKCSSEGIGCKNLNKRINLTYRMLTPRWLYGLITGQEGVCEVSTNNGPFVQRPLAACEAVL